MDVFAPIQFFADSVTYELLKLAPETYMAKAVQFFIYDVIKIGLLLVAINYVMAVTRYYFPMEKVRDILTKRRWFGLDYLLAALLGVITPFCSCSSIPLFIGFVSAGIPLGVTATFLISSPLVNEASLYLFPSIFGVTATLLYNAAGVVVSMVGGIVISRLRMEKYIQPEFLVFRSGKQMHQRHTSNAVPILALMKLWTDDVITITRKLFPYVVAGVGLGSLIHGFVPETLVSRYLSVRAWYAVPLATVMGVPLYANSISIIPIIEALVEKGVPMGTALAFMTATVALSLPEALILKKVMQWPLLLTFFGITVLGIMGIGLLFNAVY